MDPRVHEHAEILVDHCLDVEEGDEVILRAPNVAEDLVVAIYEELGKRNARPTTMGGSSRAGRAYARAVDPETIETSQVSMGAMEGADKVILVGGSENKSETSDVDPAVSQATSRAHRPVLEERLENPWVITHYPATGDAQHAEMSTEAYEDFVWSAVNRDWEAVRDHQAQLVELLDPASEVRVVSGDTTDITMSVEGMDAVNEYAEDNLPGGEVFTCPQPDSVEGEVLFDKPVVHLGREIEDARLVFEDGEVVEYDAAANEDVLESILETDEGARRLGELGIGMNREIDRFTYNTLFDEKMGDTVHMAVGKGIEDAVPEGEPMNESAVHVDMIVDMTEDSRIEIDGEVVQRDGTFVFEDGFEE